MIMVYRSRLRFRLSFRLSFRSVSRLRFGLAPHYILGDGFHSGYFSV